jgi:hypothetical protein
MNLVAFAARVTLKGKLEPNFTTPPVSVSQTWPLTLRRNDFVPLSRLRFVSEYLCRPQILYLPFSARLN